MIGHASPVWDHGTSTYPGFRLIYRSCLPLQCIQPVSALTREQQMLTDLLKLCKYLPCKPVLSTSGLTMHMVVMLPRSYWSTLGCWGKQQILAKPSGLWWAFWGPAVSDWPSKVELLHLLCLSWWDHSESVSWYLFRQGLFLGLSVEVNRFWAWPLW